MRRIAIVCVLALLVGCSSGSKPERAEGPTAEELAAMIEIQKEIERLQKEKIEAGRKFIP